MIHTHIGKFNPINSVCVAGIMSLSSFVQMKIALNSFRFVITPMLRFQGDIWGRILFKINGVAHFTTFLLDCM